MTQLAALLLAKVQDGSIDRTMLTSEMNAALTPELLASVGQQLRELGTPQNILFLSQSPSTAYQTYRYRIDWDFVSANETFAIDAHGKIAGLVFRPIALSAPISQAP